MAFIGHMVKMGTVRLDRNFCEKSGDRLGIGPIMFQPFFRLFPTIQRHIASLKERRGGVKQIKALGVLSSEGIQADDVKALSCQQHDKIIERLRRVDRLEDSSQYPMDASDNQWR